MAIGASLPLPPHLTLRASSPSAPDKPKLPDTVAQVLRKDRDFIQRGIEKLKSVHLPTLSKSLSDSFWLRTLEDPRHAPGRLLDPPNPSYPGLTGVDLMMADLEALKQYVHYFYYASKIWSMPLPEAYDPKRIAEYFKGRPHVLAFRILEICFAVGSAMIKLRTSKILDTKRFDAEKDGVNNSSQYYTGQLLKETMLNLGPTFIKVGQSLSTRPDIIGSEISEVLSELHEQIPPFPTDVAMEIIEKELGCPVEKAFSYMSEKPVAAASFGQVYRGCTVDGFDVAVKVQRPNVRQTVIRDIYLLRLGLGIVRKVAKRKSDLSRYADELGKGFVGELDYTIEASNALEFMRAHARYPFIYVPKVFGHLSRKRVLTMEWVVGENPNDLLLSRRLEADGVESLERQQLEVNKHLLDMVNKGVEATLVQLLETGLLHADPHAGNLRYTSSGQIGFLDFGLLCQMEKKHQYAMLASILHIVTGDWASLVYDFTEMDMVRPGTNLRSVTMDLEDALGEVVFEDGVPNVKFSRVLGKIWSVAFKYHLQMPSYYALLLRALASFEGLAVAVDPNFKTFHAAYPFVVRKLLTDNSAATRRIFHSVVLDKKKEFQWHRLSLFLKVGTYSNSIQGLISVDKIDQSPSLQSTASEPNGSEIARAHTILRLLLSENGAVLRRLLMTADAASLIRSMISKEATAYRQYVCRGLAGLLYQWIVQVVGKNDSVSLLYSSGMRSPIRTTVASSKESPASLIWVAMRDRRIKVILLRVLNALKREPVLMLRFCWTSLVLLLSASAVACHRFVVSFSERYINSEAFLPKRFAVNV